METESFDVRQLSQLDEAIRSTMQAIRGVQPGAGSSFGGGFGAQTGFGGGRSARRCASASPRACASASPKR